MAKYVGKIFELNNSVLKLHQSGTHFVHVQWYNPFKKAFYCKVITKLEHKVPVTKTSRRKYKNLAHRKGYGYFYLPNKAKYRRVQKGTIVPIPMSNTSGFEYWSGYEDSRYLPISALRGKECQSMKIEKKKKER